jgi:hypothetical protein
VYQLRTVLVALFVVNSLAFGICASGDHAHAQSAGLKYAALLAANPKGGKSLIAAIVEAAQGNPAEAALIVQAANDGTPEQQVAVATALRQAYNIATSNGNAEAAAAIQAAVFDASADFSTAYAGASGAESSMTADARVFISTTASGTSGAGAVSPARP